MTLQRFSKVLLVAVLLSSSLAHAKRAAPREDDEDSGTHLTYDLRAATGSYDNYSYTELTLGLNWYLTDWFNWRNSIFTRQYTGLDSVQGFDTAGLFIASTRSSGGTFGIDAFAGPGVRFASENSNAVFAEAGLIFKIGGIHLGVGAQALNYTSDRKDSGGNSLPKTDTQTFIILGGSGGIF